MQKNYNPNAQLLRLVIAGSVDDGKSTLIGRLFYDLKEIYEDQLESIKRISAQQGNDKLDLSLLTDGLSAEREQKITIDVAHRYFSTPKRRFIIADVPGHEQYTRNMATGASNANLAVILTDATKGILPQSKRHLFIVSLMGVSHISVVINKMDLVDYNQEVFEKIKADFSNFATKLNIHDLQFIPVSALYGDMIVKRDNNMNWYQGSTVASYLENIEISSDRNLLDFRFPIQSVIRPNQNFRGYAGQIEGGTIKVGETVKILPSGQTTKIKSIITNNKKQNYAFTPQTAVLTLKHELDISRGDMIVRKNNLAEVSNEFEGTICWMTNQPLNKSKRYVLKQTTNLTKCFIDKIFYRININNLHRETVKTLRFNEIGRVQISTATPIIFDSYNRNRNTGSFIIIDEITNNTVGAGTILRKAEKTKAQKSQKEKFFLKKGFTLWFTGLSQSGKSVIADKVYKLLKEKGLNVERLDGDILRESLTQDLGFSKKDRDKNVKTAAFIAKTLNRNKVVVIASFISPYRRTREKIRKEIEKDGRAKFIEVFCNCPIKICEKRDKKGLYKKARQEKIKNFTGISDPYEEPRNPEIELKTHEELIEECVNQIINYLEKNKLI